MNMKKWISDFITSKEKKTMPILSFPCTTLMNITVGELVKSASLQAEGMKKMADRCGSCASVSMMDLSVEAEAFGAEIKFSDNEVPAVCKSIVNSIEEAKSLAVPNVGAGRSGIYTEAVRLAKEKISDRPVLAGVIGPFSLGGRLNDVSEIMINCYTEPEMVKIVLEKCTAFLIEYIKAYKKAGADGVIMAEPLAGLLSPALCDEFSGYYVKKIIDSVQDDDFIVIYHNCGDNALLQINSILNVGAAAYHFGNAVSMEEIMKSVPKDVVCMGNIDPAGEFLGGTPESIFKKTFELMQSLCEKYPNFVISSGCDIPPQSPWENIDAYFDGVKAFNKERGL